MEMMLMVLMGLVYLGIIAFGIYLVLRFVRSIEQIANGVKRIADHYEQKS